MKFGTLEVTGQDGHRREYPLDLPTLVVGRAEGNGIVIDDLSISRRHARLLIESGRLLVEDLGSAQGTFIDGHIIEPNVPNLVEPTQPIRFGDVEARYLSPVPGAAAEQGSPESLLPPGAQPEEPEDAGPLSVIRLNLTDPAQPIEPGAAAFARLVIHNRGRVVDQVTVSVKDIPAEWVSLSTVSLALLPGAREEVSIVITPPRQPDSLAGDFDYSVVVTSIDFQREAIAFGSVTILPFEATALSLQPLRSKRDFTLLAENDGNTLATYALAGADDEGELLYDFELPTADLQPGEERRIRFRVRRPKRQLFGKATILPYKVVASPTQGDSDPVTADGLLAVHPPLEPYKRPAGLLALLLIAAIAALAFFVLPNDGGGTKKANAEALYAGVHMCDRKDRPLQATPQPGSGAGAPLFAQNNPSWGPDEYAKAKDPEFGPDWCGTTIEQCGCALTSVATVMALFNLLTMPDGAELTPKAVNDWYNKGATKTSHGWVSQGYVYGDVIWTAVNELSGEIAKVKPGSPSIRFVRTGTGTEGEIKSELQAGRPIILEVPGHWIAAVGLDGDKIIINDPYYADRRTLDVYKGKVKSSVLFEQSNDLSGFVVTVPKSERVKITDKAGNVVGTLNTGTDSEVKESIQTGIAGAYYSTKDAWRDPTCVESPPRPGDGTTQIFLPGSKDDYKIEVLSPDGGPTSVAFHRYDKNGKSAFEVKDNSGPAVIAASFDPANVNAGGASVIPGATPTAENSRPGSNLSPGGGANQTPDGSGTPNGTVTPGGTSTVGGSPTATRTAVPTPTPLPPAAVTVACQVQYSQTPSKNAAVSCTSTISGNYTSTAWTVNGVIAPSSPGATTFATSFASDTVVTIGSSACNVTQCASGSQAVTVKFPAVPPSATPTNTPLPTGSVTPTPPPGNPPAVVTVVCTYVAGSFPLQVDCATAFGEPFTQITWTAVNGSPGTKTSADKTFTTFRASPGDVRVSAKVCYYSSCTTSNEAIVSAKPTAITVQAPAEVCAGEFATFQVTVTSPSGAPANGEISLYIDGQLFGNLAADGDTVYFSYTTDVPGPKNYHATYSGFDLYDSATSPNGILTVNSCGG